jgi:hypothetical protein
MEGPLEIRPSPSSFARRSPADVEGLLSQAGGRAGEPWQVPTGDGGRIAVRLEAADGELRAVHIEADGGAGAAGEAMLLAARLAERLHWKVVDASGTALDPVRLRRRLQGRSAAMRSLLTVLGGVMAVVFGFAWAVERGLAPGSLLLALLGLLLYAAMRTWGWLEHRLGQSCRGSGGAK